MMCSRIHLSGPRISAARSAITSLLPFEGIKEEPQIEISACRFNRNQ